MGGWPGSPENVSCSRETPDLHRCNLGVALEQETFSGLPGHSPKVTTCSFSYRFSGSEKGVFWKRGLLEKGSFQKSPFSRDSREFRDSRDFRESSDFGKQRRIRPFSRDSREFRDFRDSRDSRDSCSEKTPFVMTPFSGPEI